MQREFPLVTWGDTIVTFRPYREGGPQPDEAVAALVFAFYGEKLLLADIQNRGWCIPGGRLESGETAKEAARREAWEECGAKLGPLTPLGFTISVAPAANSQSAPTTPPATTPPELGGRTTVPYGEAKSFVTAPRDAERILAISYAAPVLRLDHIPASSESRGVRLVERAEVASCYYRWDALMAAMFDYAWEHRGPSPAEP